MGTRSFTIIRDANNEENPILTVIYRQFDGYPSGQGRAILDALKGKKCVNGYSDDDQINGAGDLAVQLVACMKQGSAQGYDFLSGEAVQKPLNTPGGIYLCRPDVDADEEYVYEITFPKLTHKIGGNNDNPGLMLKVTGHDRLLYEGPLDNFDVEAAERLENGEDDDE